MRTSRARRRFDPNDDLEQTGPGDYMGFAADPRDGSSTFHVLTLGARNTDGVLNSQDIYSYTVHLRPKGDYDGDYDFDNMDAFFGPCAEYKNSACAALDFDEDHDVDAADLDAFYHAMTGPLSQCQPTCLGPPPESAGAGWTEEQLAETPEDCAAARWYATHAPREDFEGFVAQQLARLADQPSDRDAGSISHFLDCAAAILGE